ncbi:MAG TPA: carboxypeptidase-like regulatory domain-containing protein [Bryobacteraceae bacterium]|nr:carboxypeptidase-like regulatory domain-containing protein [Bryobacteraceae bacterium]
MRKAIVCRFLLVVWLFPLGQNLLAQSSSGGSITGTVMDPSGATIPNASVAVKNNGTGVTSVGRTTSAGQFVFPVIPAGEYTITIAAPGFSQSVITAVTVAPNQTTTESVQLQVGANLSRVEVQASAVHLETETAQQATSFDQKTYANLPLALAGAPRSPTALSDLMPGVAVAPANNSTFSEPGETQIFSQTVNGGQTLASEVYYDGVALLQTNVAGDYRYQPVPVEAISEFTLVQNNFSSEYSRTPGGIVSLNTRSGTNKWRGEAYEYNENSAMNAAGQFNTSVPVERQNEFGVSFGGPIRKDKTFIFGYYSGFRYTAQKPAFLTTIPTAAMVKGDFSHLTDAQGHVIPIYDPTTTKFDPTTGLYTRQQLQCNGILNVICPGRISNVAKQFIPYIPTNYANGNNTANYLGGGITSDSYNRYGAKLDHYFSEKDIIHAFFGISPYHVLYPTEVYKDPFTGIGFDEPDDSMVARFSEDHSFSPSVLNHFAIGYNRDNALYTAERTFSHITLGIQNIPNVTPAFGLGQYGSAGWGDPGQNIRENGYVASDFVSLVKGRHSLKIGGEIRKYEDNTIPISSSQFNFSTAETANPSAPNPADTGNEFASFLIGAVDNASQQYTLDEITAHFYYLGMYLQDDFKVNRKLTLNLGLRYDIPWTRKIKNNIFSSFQPDFPNPGAGNIPGALVFAGKGSINCNCTRFSDTRFNLFQPRFGFAYGLNDSTVIRGGVGVFEGSAGDVLENGTRNAFTDGFNANPSFSSPDGGITPAFYIDNGFPQFPRPPFLDPTLDNGSNINYLARADGTPPRVIYWNLDVQRRLPGNFLLDIGYVANSARHISGALANPNQLNPESLSLGNILNQQFTPAIGQQYNVPLPYPGFTGTVAQALRPFPQYLSINQPMQTSGKSHYNSLQVKMQRQFSSGLSVLLSYTYANLMTTSESQHQYLDASGGAQNTYDLTGELTPSASLPPHVVNLAYVYELPFGHGKRFDIKPAVANAILGGWQVSAIQRYQSGTPMHISIPEDLTHPGPLYNYDFRPDLVLGQSLKANWTGKFDPSKDVYLNAAAFATPAPFTLGNAARTLPVRTFGYYNEDVGLAKHFRFGEVYDLTLQGNAFNIFNRTAWGGPDTFGPGTNPDFGHINSQANTPRVLQVSLDVKF